MKVLKCVVFGFQFSVSVLAGGVVPDANNAHPGYPILPLPLHHIQYQNGSV